MKIKTFMAPVIFFFLLVCFSCDFMEEKPDPVIPVDFKENDSSQTQKSKKNILPELNVAVSAIISPRETFKYYKDLFNYISKKAKVKIVFKQRKTYREVNLLLRKNLIDVAFVCSGAYVEEKKISGTEILAVPVCQGVTGYQAYIIVNKSSPINRFEDLRGHSFAYTDPLSNTGTFYPKRRLKELNESSDHFFSKTIYTHAHDISIQLVSKKLIDGASVDGLILEYLIKHNPEKYKNVKIIEKSEYFGIPPVVSPAGIDENLKLKLKDIFFNIHNDPEGREILDKIMIDRFVEGQDSIYNSIRRMVREFK